MRLVGSGLGRSRGSGGSFPSSHTRLLSLRKGKDRVRGASGERSGVPEGDVRLGSAMSAVMKISRTGEDDVDAGSFSVSCCCCSSGCSLLTLLSVLCSVCGSVCSEEEAATLWTLSCYPGQRCQLSSVKMTCCEEKDATEKNQRKIKGLSRLDLMAEMRGGQ